MVEPLAAGLSNPSFLGNRWQFERVPYASRAGSAPEAPRDARRRFNPMMTSKLMDEREAEASRILETCHDVATAHVPVKNNGSVRRETCGSHRHAAHSAGCAAGAGQVDRR